MAEITETRGGEMRRATIQVVLGHPDGLRARDVFVELAKFLPPTPFESEDYPNRPGVRRYEKVVRFRSIKLVKAGWLVKTAGIWTVTDEGKKAFQTLVTPAAFNKEVNRLYKERL